MELQQTQCPNCGSAEFFAPEIDNQVALAMMRNRPLPPVTVTCTHCGSKYQTNASFNMGLGKPPAPTPAPAAITPLAPQEKYSKSTLRTTQVLVFLTGVFFALVGGNALIGLFSEPPEQRGHTIKAILYCGASAALFFAIARRYGKRIANIQKRINNQL